MFGGLKVKNDNETKQKLLVSANLEFMEKGYMRASLRNICKNAGVTTGALYFLFRDKEDLFASLVEEPLNKLLEVMNQHYIEEMKLENTELLNYDFSEDVKAAKQIIYYMYQYYDAFHLILQKSQGSKFEKSIDQFVTISEKHNRLLADKYSQYTQSPKVDDYMIHWMAHMQVDSFIYMLTHEKSVEAAMQYMESIIRFLISGWFTMFHTDKI